MPKETSNNLNTKPRQKINKIFLATLIFLFLIYFISSPKGNTPYNYFTRLSEALLQGKYWITENPPWLSELIPAGQKKFYIVYPPIPAILLSPFVFLFGKNFPQQYLAHFLGAGTAILTGSLAFKITKKIRVAVYMTTLAGIGTIIWFLSSVGSAWYLGQISATFLLTAAIVESFNKKRTFLVGLLIGSSYLSRLQSILSIPLFIFLLKGKLKNRRDLLLLILPIFIFISINFYYNWLRYDVIWDKGYFLIPGTQNEPWFSKGIFHPSYIIEDVKIALLKLPIFTRDFPYIIPSWAGMAIWITTPVFIYILKAPLKDKLNIMAWIAIFSIWLVNGMHGGTGFAQFGYRFAVDFYPFLFLLLINYFHKTGIKPHHWVLLGVSIIVNLWGIIWINKFGWVTW